jgi:hypothetical protein
MFRALEEVICGTKTERLTAAVCRITQWSSHCKDGARPRWRILKLCGFSWQLLTRGLCVAEAWKGLTSKDRPFQLSLHLP